MGIRENKATVERFDRLTGASELDPLDEICTPDMVNHALALHRPPGLAGTNSSWLSPRATRASPRGGAR
jgi:hypothetical protein